MATRQPLEQLIPKIIIHFQYHKEHLEFDHRVFQILEGQLKAEIEESLRKEMLSKTAYNRAIQRIPTLNILKQATDKLSKLYADEPVRFASRDSDKDIMTNLVKEMRLDENMLKANKILNAQNRAALEFYIKDGEHRARVLAAHQFLPFSDDTSDPNNMTVFIKLMGQERPMPQMATDSQGNNLDDQNEIDLVDILALYSDDEFMIIDTSGAVRTDLMARMGVTSTVNPFGTIPFVYLPKSDFQLIPYVNQSGLDMSILIPKLLTDLNYAAQFMSHSLIWYKNADLSGTEAHPDAMINLGTTDKDENDAAIGTVDPQVEIEKVLQLIQFEMSGYLSTIGIKTGNVGSMMPGREASGISKLIDEGDVSSEQKAQAQKFKIWERELWEKVAKMQVVLSNAGAVTENRLFSKQFIDSFNIHYAESLPFKSDADRIDEIKTMRDAGLMSRRRAIQTINPQLTTDQLDEWISEIEDEESKQRDEMLSIAGRTDAPVEGEESEPEPTDVG